MMRDARLTLSRPALLNNLNVVRRHAPRARVLAMVKAEAYGHGAVLVARTLAPHADALGVAFLAEALALRAAGLDGPLSILEGVFTAEELDAALAARCDLVVHQPEQVELLAAYTGDLRTTVWLKVDSGMHRLGLDPLAAEAAHARLRALPVVRDLILTSHFASADDLAAPITGHQIASFDRLAERLPALPHSLANSAAILAWPSTHRDWVRPGIMLYGSSPFADRSAASLGLQPAMTLASRLIAIQHIPAGERIGYGGIWQAARDSRIGVVGIGYGDGYPRHIRPGTPALVNGQRVSIVGRVSMDMLTVDLTDIDAGRGDPVVLWGDGLPVDEIAACAGTISYELLCQVTPRVSRQVH